MQETQGTWARSLGWEDPPGVGDGTHFSILAWKAPWTEEPGGLLSPLGLQESDTIEHAATLQHGRQILHHLSHQGSPSMSVVDLCSFRVPSRGWFNKHFLK